DSGSLFWYWEQGMARSDFPTRAQQVAMQERDRAMRRSKHFLVRSDRFWEVTHDENVVTDRYGKVGSAGRLTSRTYPGTSAAYLEKSRMVDRKLKEGYVEKA